MTFATERQMVDLVFRLPKAAIFASETMNANLKIILSECVYDFALLALMTFATERQMVDLVFWQIM